MIPVRPRVVDATLRRIQSEYYEMPGLSLTASEAQRLWGLSREECEAILNELIGQRFLRRTRAGAFVRVD